VGVREVYKKFFEETPQAAQAVEDAKDWADGTLALWEQPAFRALVDKIQFMADGAIPITGDLAAAVGRSNGVKEVLALIRGDLLRARRTVDATRTVAGET